MKQKPPFDTDTTIRINPGRQKPRVDEFTRFVTKLAKNYPIYRGNDGAELASFLRKIINPQRVDSQISYNNIGRAARLANGISKSRGITYDEFFFSDPLSAIRVLVELDKVANAGKSGSARQSTVDESVILASILVPVCRYRKDSAGNINFAAQKGEVDNALQQIEEAFPGALGKKVAGLVQHRLLISEMNLKSGSVPGWYQQSQVPAVPEDSRIVAFNHMIAERVEMGTELVKGKEAEHVKGRDVVLMSGVQWLLFTRKVSSEGDPAEREKIPHYVDLTNQIYLPLAASYSNEQGKDVPIMVALKKALEDQRLKMDRPEVYWSINKKLVERAKAGIPKKEKAYAHDYDSASALVLKNVQNLLQGIIEKSPVAQHYAVTLELRPKSRASAARKSERKGPERDHDYIAARVIIENAADPDDLFETAIAKEFKASMVVYAAIANHMRRMEKVHGLREVKSEFDNYYKTPHKSGYRGVHTVFSDEDTAEKEILKTPKTEFEQGSPKASTDGSPGKIAPPEDIPRAEVFKFEIQIKGRRTHEANESGAGDHRLHEGINLIDVEAAKKSVSIFINRAGEHEGTIQQLPRGATVADALASISPKTAFTAIRLNIDRLHHDDQPVILKSVQQRLRFPVHPGDTLTFETLPFGPLNSDKYRATVIDASKVPEIKSKLELFNMAFEIGRDAIIENPSLLRSAQSPVIVLPLLSSEGATDATIPYVPQGKRRNRLRSKLHNHRREP